MPITVRISWHACDYKGTVGLGFASRLGLWESSSQLTGRFFICASQNRRHSAHNKYSIILQTADLSALLEQVLRATS